MSVYGNKNEKPLSLLFYRFTSAIHEGVTKTNLQCHWSGFVKFNWSRLAPYCCTYVRMYVCTGIVAHKCTQ